ELQLAAFDQQARSAERIANFGDKFEAADRGDRGERFAAKAKRRDPKQVFAFSDLRGRVALNAEFSVLRLHPAAVVDDANKVTTALLELDLDPSCARIERVLHKLPHRACGALDDFAR